MNSKAVSQINGGNGGKDAKTVPRASEREIDATFFALSNYRRRFVLEHLQRTEGAVSLRTLSEELAAWENEVDTRSTTAVQRKRAYVSLRQTHLPKLDELDIVEFDAARGEVIPREAAESLTRYLHEDSTSKRRTGMGYLGIGRNRRPGLAYLGIGSLVGMAILFAIEQLPL